MGEKPKIKLTVIEKKGSGNVTRVLFVARMQTLLIYFKLRE